MKPRVDLITIIALGMLLTPLLTMWHEIAGHALFCAVQSGHIRTIGAFYVDCEGLAGGARVLVSCAGVMMNVLLAAVAYVSWRRATSDRARLTLWLVCVSESFVAAGYLCFSGATGFGDLGPGGSEGIGPLRMPMLWRTGEFLLGIAIYGLLVAWANRTLSAMIGNGAETRTARQTIALGYYATTGVAALLTGLLNPVGAVVTVMSAAASPFGGQAGLISVAFATRRHGKERPFVIGRNWAVFVVGAVVLIAFAAILGPSVRL